MSGWRFGTGGGRQARIRGRIDGVRSAAGSWTAPRHPAVLHGRTLVPSTEPRGLATDALFARLDAADVAAIEARLDPHERQLVRDASALDRKRALLALGVHHGLDVVVAKSGLTRAEPPPEVHATGRGALAAGGTTYYADLVLDTLADAGVGAAANRPLVRRRPPRRGALRRLQPGVGHRVRLPRMAAAAQRRRVERRGLPTRPGRGQPGPLPAATPLTAWPCRSAASAGGGRLPGRSVSAAGAAAPRATARSETPRW